jgi:hypothetical protein
MNVKPMKRIAILLLRYQCHLPASHEAPDATMNDLLISVRAAAQDWDFSPKYLRMHRNEPADNQHRCNHRGGEIAPRVFTEEIRLLAYQCEPARRSTRRSAAMGFPSRARDGIPGGDKRAGKREWTGYFRGDRSPVHPSSLKQMVVSEKASYDQ